MLGQSQDSAFGKFGSLYFCTLGALSGHVRSLEREGLWDSME